MRKSTDQLTVDEIHEIVTASGNLPKPTPALQALASVVIGVPVFLTVLPVSLVYQLVKTVYQAATGTTQKAQEQLAPLDSGIVVEGVIDRPAREYDVVLLGATGFTGKLATRHLAATYGKETLKWAVAGRSQSKLDGVKKDLAEEFGVEVDTIVVDTSKPETLPGLVRNSRVIITTAGPFEKYGSPVVEACAKYGTHYVDITGETSWVKHMILKWGDTAKKTGAKIVSLCGHDSVPWDLTVFKLESALPEGESLSEVSCIDEFQGGASGGTLATIVMNIDGTTRGEPDHPFDVASKLPDGTQSSSETRPSFPLLPSQFQTPGRHRSSWLGYFIMSAVNADVVKRSNALRQRSPNLAYFEAATQPDLKTGVAGLLTLPLLLVSLLNPVTKFVLTEFVLPKPGQGPSMEDMVENSMLCVTGYGRGSRGTTVESVMYFPKCGGYLETARMVTESGLCLALEEDQLPIQGGGFFTPSTGLGEVLLERLVNTGTYFAIQTTSG